MTTSYYHLLGVEPGADKNEIRRAYQEKRSIDGGTEASARLAEAWNVLSDPYQRDRYDEALARGELDSEYVSGDDIEVIRDAPAPKGFLAKLANQKQQNAKNAKTAPDIVLADGSVPAPNSKRLLGVLIDGLGFFFIFVAISLIGERVAQIDRNDKGEIISGNMVLMTVILLLGFSVVYFVIEMLGTHYRGQTVGRRIARVKIVDRATGALPSWQQSFKRAVVPLVAMLVLFPLLGQLAFVIVLAIVMWSYSDLGKQGLHDKFAKTIAVDARPESQRPRGA